MDLRFNVRELHETRSFADKVVRKQLGCSSGQYRKMRQELIAELRSCGCSNPFMAYVQTTIRKMKCMGTWKYGLLSTHTTHEIHEGKDITKWAMSSEGQEFMKSMSKAWSDIRGAEEGALICAEARKSLEERTSLRRKITEIDAMSAEAAGEVHPDVLMGEFGFGNVAHIMTANAYSHVSGNLERVKAWRNSYDSFLTVVQPQPKTAPLPSPVRCCDVGFCLKKYKEANTFDELKCFVGAIGPVFHTRSKFATRHAQDISALRLYIVVSFERKDAAAAAGGAPSFRRCKASVFRTLIGNSARQLFARISVDDHCWVRGDASRLPDAKLDHVEVSQKTRPKFMDGWRLAKHCLEVTAISHPDCNTVRCYSATSRTVAFKHYSVQADVSSIVVELNRAADNHWTASVVPEKHPVAKPTQLKKGSAMDALLALGRPQKPKPCKTEASVFMFHLVSPMVVVIVGQCSDVLARQVVSSKVKHEIKEEAKDSDDDIVSNDLGSDMDEENEMIALMVEQAVLEADAEDIQK